MRASWAAPARVAGLLLIAGIWSAPAGAGGARCPGDCDGDGAVAINELVQAVTIATGAAPVARCAAADAEPDGQVSVSELVRAVNSALGGCPDEMPGPELVVVQRRNLQPEGIEYDEARGRFLLGSRTEGVIHAVDDEGAMTPVVTEPGLSVSLGLHIDRARDRLLAAGAIGTAPALGIYALGSGEPLDVIDLSATAGPGPHLANDVVVDADGNAYVTDTLTPALYRVALDGTATIFADDMSLSRANGIELYDDRYLIVATLTGPSLVRVPLDDPDAAVAIETPEPVGGDGIVFMAGGDLAVVGSAGIAGTVLRLRSDDDWASAQVVDTWDASALGFGDPTTAAVRGADVYVVFAHLFDEAREAYEIARAGFAGAP